MFPYAELHCKSNFSFLEGASHADELFLRAAELGYYALAITDRQSLAGIVRAYAAAKEVGVKLIVGAEIHPCDAPSLVLWASDRASYGRLSRLITVGRRRASKGACEIYLADIAAHRDGLLAGLLPTSVIASLRNRAPETSSHRVSDPTDPAGRDDGGFLSRSKTLVGEVASLRRLRDLFGDRAYLLAELHYGPDDQAVLEQLIQFARQLDVPLAAAGDVHYHVPERILLQDVLSAIREGTTVAALGDATHRFANAQRHLRSHEQLQSIYAAYPEALAVTTTIADRCHFSLSQLRYEYPEYGRCSGREPIVPLSNSNQHGPDDGTAGNARATADESISSMEYLRELTWQGARWRYPGTIPPKVCRLLDQELHLIEELRYEAYFLTVWDLVRFARSRGILCQGRGSAANSAVCFCLGITAVDPERMDVLFERFISRERNEAPDIDVDFEHERREEVLQYLYEKYGRDRAGMTAAVITYRLRSAIRDVGKALGISLDRVDAVAKQVEGYDADDQLSERFRQAGVDPRTRAGRQWIETVALLIGFPRHLSQHVGGMVMTRGPLNELVPIENAAMPDRTVISWDKYDLDELGILKVDCLGLGMLTAIQKCFDLICQQTGRRWTLATIPPDDQATYDMICRSDTIGVFQIESRAQMSMLPRLRPRCYYDLVIEVAIVRPGPIQGQMVHPYLRRRNGLEPVSYANDQVRRVLEKTLGVPLFQEQAMQLAIVAAGFTPGEADQLRRAMGAWRRTGSIDKFRAKLIDGMRQRGYSEEFAQQLFQQLRGFGEYGFPESHAASFALLVYVSAWLKCHYPACFLAAMLNSQPLGFYAPAQLVRDARDHGVTVFSVDVNYSHWDSTVTANSVRLGFRTVVGFPRQHADTIVAARDTCHFSSMQDFAQRTRLPESQVTRLAKAGAFTSLGKSRRQMIWDALAQKDRPYEQGLLAGLPAEDEDPVNLPELDPMDAVMMDYVTTGLSLQAHPLSFYRSALARQNVSTAQQLCAIDHGASVVVAGLVLMRQRPSTAKGITFVTLEDETGTVNLIVRQGIWDRFYMVARRSPAWAVFGQLQRKYSVIHVLAERLCDLAQFLNRTEAAAQHQKSRDFR